jgi:sterol 3beta-glucosyltransferase
VFPNWKLGGWYNLFTHNFLIYVSGFFQTKYIKRWAKVNNLPPIPKKIGVLHNRHGEHIPVLNAYSKQIFPKPFDWDENVFITGYWFLDEQNDYQPSKELQAFLDAGEPPVYVGFGSMAGKKPERVTRIVIDALQKAYVRGLLASGWGGLAPEDLPDSIMMIDHAPHDWLFPRVSAVVHHGGAGTTAAGLRAGKPTVICPFIVDQPFWGRRVFEMGVGSQPIPQKKLNVDNLASALIEVTSNPSIQQNAQVIGEKIRAEDGVKNAVKIIEEIILKNRKNTS